MSVKILRSLGQAISEVNHSHNITKFGQNCAAETCLKKRYSGCESFKSRTNYGSEI